MKIPHYTCACCPAKSADCAHGQMRNSTSCLQLIARFMLLQRYQKKYESLVKEIPILYILNSSFNTHEMGRHTRRLKKKSAQAGWLEKQISELARPTKELTESKAHELELVHDQKFEETK
jgi:hypothetical protein